jgi:hypothetical protein
MTWSSSDNNYKKQTGLTNDDSASEREIDLTKDNCGPVIMIFAKISTHF